MRIDFLIFLLYNNIKVYIDGDGCPVVRNTIKICKQYAIKCVIICDNTHSINFEDAQTIIVDKGADSADFAIVNILDNPCIVVTQDYGLAAMCMAKGASVINQNEAKKLRQSGRVKGNISKRTQMQDKAFEEKLVELIENMKNQRRGSV